MATHSSILAWRIFTIALVSPVAQLVKNPPAMQESWVQPLGWEDSPREQKGYPLQYSGLKNSMDCIVHGVTKSLTWLSDFPFSLASPRTEEPGRLQSMGSLGVGHN